MASEAEAAGLLVASVRGLQLALRHPTHVCPFCIKFHFDCATQLDTLLLVIGKPGNMAFTNH